MSREDIEQLVDRMLLTLKYAEEPEWKVLAEYIEDLQQENKQLKDRINKAIEYIEEKCSMELGVLCEYGDNLNPKEVVVLLKGDK